MSQEVKKAPDYLEDARLPEEVKEFLKGVNAGPPVESLSKEEARQVLTDAQAAFDVDYSGIEESECTVAQDGMSVRLTIVRPQEATGVLPAFLFIHGGGWILGDYPTHRRLVRDLVVESGYPAVFVNYTPSPEAHYPLALREIYAAVRWVASHGEEIGVDGSRLAIVGNSVGGNMSIATSLWAGEHGGPRFKLQVLLWPVADAGFDTRSYAKFAGQRFLTAPLMKWMFDQYTTDPAQRREIYVSPLRAPVDRLKDLPPTLIEVAENDILRDEAEQLGRKLADAGVDVTTLRYDGAIHDWGMLNGLANLPQTRTLVVVTAAMLRRYLD